MADIQQTPSDQYENNITLLRKLKLSSETAWIFSIKDINVNSNKCFS